MLLEIHSDAGGVLRASRMSWSMVVWLARDAGWAAGQRLIVDGLAVWPGDTGGLRLEPDEARAFAEALTAALPDIPDHDAMSHKVAWVIDFPEWSEMVRDTPAERDELGRPATYRLRYLQAEQKVAPYEYFSGPNKSRLRRLIRLCEGGGLNIQAQPTPPGAESSTS